MLIHVDVSDKGHDPHLFVKKREEFLDDLYKCSKCGLRLRQKDGKFQVLTEEGKCGDYRILTCEEIQAKSSWLAITEPDSTEEVAALIRKEGGEKVAIGIGNRVTFVGNRVTRDFVQMDEKVEKVIGR
jgi:hypothetical protein